MRLCKWLIFLGLTVVSCGTQPCISLMPKLYDRDQKWITYNYDMPVPFVNADGMVDSLYAPPSVYYEASSQEAMPLVSNDDTCFEIGNYTASFSLTIDSMRIDFGIIKYHEKFIASLPDKNLVDTMEINIAIHDLKSGKYSGFNVLDSTRMRHNDSLEFQGYIVADVFENVTAQEVVRRFLISPAEGIIFLELTDGRSWTKQKFASDRE